MYNQHRAEGNRKQGRPKKDEIIIRKFVVHDWDKIKPKNKMAYVKETIQTANGLYKRYSRPYPNPLNVDDKDLDPDSKACWDYIFSQRGYDGIPVEETRGRHKTINAEEVVFAFECYTEWIRKNNFVRAFTRPDGETGVMPIIPNQTNFARWLGVSGIIITDAIKNNDDAKHSYKNILADCLSEGAMVGVYQTASTIFTLKNMCDWADKYEDRSKDKADDLGVSEAEELMRQLGYAREKAKLEPPKPMLEGDVDG